MFAKRTVLATLTVILVIVIFFAWTAWNEDHLYGPTFSGWAPHVPSSPSSGFGLKTTSRLNPRLEPVRK